MSRKERTALKSEIDPDADGTMRLLGHRAFQEGEQWFIEDPQGTQFFSAMGNSEIAIETVQDQMAAMCEDALRDEPDEPNGMTYA